MISRKDEYGWAKDSGVDLISSIDPIAALTDAKSIILLIKIYFRKAFRPSLEDK